MTVSDPTDIPVRPGHPPGLTHLFMTEIWERFAFFGIRALLILFLIKHFNYEDGDAYATQGSFFVIQHLAPIAGGLIADRIFGFRRSINLGGALLIVGPALLALSARLESDGAAIASFTMFLGLAATAVGTGFIKPVTATTLGALYAEDDPARDSGFTLFYVGINIGAFASAATVGYIGETWGWGLGFGICAVAMALGIVAYNLGGRHYAHVWNAPDEQRLKRARWGVRRDIFYYAAIILATIALAFVIPMTSLVGYALGVTVVLATAGLLYYAFRYCEPVARDRLIVAIVLMGFASIFWAIFSQSYNSLMTFNDRLVDREIWGFELRAPQLLSLNPIFIITLGPLFTVLWKRLADRGIVIPTVVKFAIALMLLGLAMAVLGARASFVAEADVSVLWVVLLFFIFTLAELFLGPIGLAMITKLSPKRIAAFMMGFWFVSFSIAEFASALLAQLLTGWGATPEMPPVEALALYGRLFFILAAMGVGAGLVLLLLRNVIGKRMHGV